MHRPHNGHYTDTLLSPPLTDNRRPGFVLLGPTWGENDRLQIHLSTRVLSADGPKLIRNKRSSWCLEWLLIRKTMARTWSAHLLSERGLCVSTRTFQLISVKKKNPTFTLMPVLQLSANVDIHKCYHAICLCSFSRNRANKAKDLLNTAIVYLNVSLTLSQFKSKRGKNESTCNVLCILPRLDR